jgi:hypothetical protein
MRPNIPGFGVVPNRSGQYGTAVTTLVPYVTGASRSQTCTFTGTSISPSTVWVTETAISTSGYNAITAWYDANAQYAVAGGGATTPGYPTDTIYWFDFKTVHEQAIISPDGWWITMRIQGVDVRGSAGYDLVDQFLARNPLRH